MQNYGYMLKNMPPAMIYGQRGVAPKTRWVLVQVGDGTEHGLTYVVPFGGAPVWLAAAGVICGGEQRQTT